MPVWLSEQVGLQMVIPRYYEPQDMFIGAKIVVHHQVSCLLRTLCAQL